MKNKGFAPIIILIILGVLVVAGGAYYFGKKSAPAQIGIIENPPLTEATTTAATAPVNFSESEILTSLKTNWQTIQTLIPFRPAYHNQIENAKKIWRTPDTAQFIEKNNVLVRFGDDNNVHVAVFNFNGSKFNLLEVFKNQAEFTLFDWQNLVHKYGSSSYSVSTYTVDLVRNGQIVSFQDLTKVSENVFIKNYWESLPTTCTDQQEGAPVITSISPTSGPIGTKIEIKGCNFSGFEAAKDAVIVNSNGEGAFLAGEPTIDSKLITVVLKSPICKVDNSASGLPCPAFLTLTPGLYKIYTTPWGKKSNETTFTILGQ